jgi:hypothetical protein
MAHDATVLWRPGFQRNGQVREEGDIGVQVKTRRFYKREALVWTIQSAGIQRE